MDAKSVHSCTIFLTKVGSHAYGTNTPTSDIDIKGVCIPTDKSYYIGMGINRFEQKDGGWDTDEDKVVYDIRKAMKLMADANPNMLDLLFCREEDFQYCHGLWNKVRHHRDKFLSKKVRHTFGGYAFAQLKRIQRHRAYLINPPKAKPERADFGLPEQEKLISQEQMGVFQWLLAKTLQDSIEELRLSDETKEELYGVNYIGLVQGNIDDTDDYYHGVKLVTGAPDEWIEAVMREKRYSNALKQWNAYNKWKKERNEKRQVLEAKFGYDTKHAMHLVRLMRMGIEILAGRGVQVYRPDREELLAIRDGAWEYEQVVDYAQKAEMNLIEMSSLSKLPKNPDRVFLDNLCQEVIERYVF